MFVVDIDECAQNPSICGNGDCINTLGSFHCRCEDGYSVKPGEGPSCSDDDECYLGSYTCDVNADCINNPVGDKTKSTVTTLIAQISGVLSMSLSGWLHR